MANILSLSASEAMDFFMSPKRYCTIELPEYYTFDTVLNYVRETIGEKGYTDCLCNVLPETLDDVNMDLPTNKDGKYAVRPLSVANPYLYYFLVRELCSEDGWKAVKDCFHAFSNENIEVCGLPVLDNIFSKELFHNSNIVLNWWKTMEQRSIELSLDYKYMFVTDITKCYDSIDRRTLVWALGREDTAKQTEEYNGMANRIVELLSAFQQGRNIGIPQGSAVFDLVAELILGYSDLLLHEELDRKGITDYRIIRYRDDYRIFCNSKDVLEEISFTLQRVLGTLNFSLNTSKTKISDSIVTDAIKPDKLWYIKNTPVFKSSKRTCTRSFNGIQKYLLFVLQMGREFPNAGQLKVLLTDVHKMVQDYLKPRKVPKRRVLFTLGRDTELKPPTEGQDVKVANEPEFVEVKGKLWEPCAITAVAIQIALENVAVTHYALRVASSVINSIEDEEEKAELIGKVCNKLGKRHNNDYDQIWLQNISYQKDRREGRCPYSVRLCHLAMGEDVQIWNNTWLKPELTAELPLDSICQQETMENVTPLISFREKGGYCEGYGFEDFVEPLDSDLDVLDEIDNLEEEMGNIDVK